jgi:hypothetical protein
VRTQSSCIVIAGLDPAIQSSSGDGLAARVKFGHVKLVVAAESGPREGAMTGSSYEGGCSCGAVRYRVDGPPRYAAHCHCRDCRRTTAAAFATYASYDRDRLAWIAGPPKVYRSSPDVERRFCGACGTPLTYEGKRWADEIGVLACTLDDPSLVKPTRHVYVAHQVPWLTLGDGLPRFRTVPSESGGVADG